MSHHRIFLMACAAAFAWLSVATVIADPTRNVVSLDGPGWKLAGLKPGEGERLGVYRQLLPGLNFIPTSIPNNVQLVIGLKDPYGQDLELVEVNRREWWYVRSFASPRFNEDQQIRLLFDGVDYFADVWLNGEKLGGHEGAYTRFGFDISKKIGQNRENYLAVKVTAPWKVPGRSHYEFMKGEFLETWDALPGPGQVVFPLGLHRSVRVEVSNQTRIEELQISTLRLSQEGADLKVRTVLNSLIAAPTITLKISIQSENFEGGLMEIPLRTVAFSGPVGEPQVIEQTYRVSHPCLWWTWDQGPQNLYRATATLVRPNGKTLDSLSTTFGIRTLERDDKLLYKINGRPVFLRGSWYSMSRLYPGETDRWTYAKDLQLAKHANMNHMVNYTVVEKEDFYDLADRLGILLFVELPFNQFGPLDALNARYPRRDEFLRWSSQEVAQIVRALANHPSVGVWSPISETTGNGEDFATSPYDSRIVEAADGYQLFVKKIEETVAANDPDALYFRSYCDFGERHFWEGAFFPGTSYDEHFDAAAGFVSEYGALAFYPWESIRRVLNPEDLWLGSQGKPWSDLKLPLNLKKMSYLTGWQYFGLTFLSENIFNNVDRNPQSLRDYVNDSQVYQAFLYGYAADAYRRKLFSPINGIRSWYFKDFPEKPVSGFGVIDCFHAPKMAYYAMKRTWAPVSMSYGIRYPLESVLAGSLWKVPVWISNATNSNLSLSVETSLLNLTGEPLQQFSKQVSVNAMRAETVFTLGWQLPEKPGLYLVRGRASSEKGEVANTEMYIKVISRATERILRVLVVGTADWAFPVADYLGNLGADVTVVTPQHEEQFPTSAESLQQKFDVLWLAGFNNYWREAPEEYAEIMVKAVASGVTFIHSGSWGSFHGGGERTAGLDLTPISAVLPVEVKHENDVFASRVVKSAGLQLQPPAVVAQPATVKALPAAPEWLRKADFTGLSVENYHLLTPHRGATTLLELEGSPLLVVGQYGKGRSAAYLGFSPEAERRKVPDHQPIVVDRAIRSSPENRLFAMVSAALLAFASGSAPSVSLNELIEARAVHLFEILKNSPKGALPEVSLTWTSGKPSHKLAQIRIQNGPNYLRGLRLRLEGPAYMAGDAIALWDNQFFDLLPAEVKECNVEIVSAAEKPLTEMTLEAEAVNGTGPKSYKVPPLQ